MTCLLRDATASSRASCASATCRTRSTVVLVGRRGSSGGRTSGGDSVGGGDDGGSIAFVHARKGRAGAMFRGGA